MFAMCQLFLDKVEKSKGGMERGKKEKGREVT